MKVPGLHGLSAWAVAKRTFKEYLDDDLLTYASALAFQALFSLFPFVLFLTALLGFLQLGSFFQWLQGIATSMLPSEAAGVVSQVIAGLQKQKAGLLSFGVAAALWGASSGVRLVMKAMNVAYEVPEGRPTWKLYLLSIIYTIGLAAMLTAAAALLVLGPKAMDWIARQIGLQQVFVTVWAWLRWPAALFILILAVAVIYYVSPNLRHRFRLVSPGAVTAVVVWIAASAGFKLYVQNFGNYNAMYGSIGAIIVLLLYFFISAAVLLLGAEINAVIEHASGEVEPAQPRRLLAHAGRPLESRTS